jgi:hypothetical protein
MHVLFGCGLGDLRGRQADALVDDLETGVAGFDGDLLDLDTASIESIECEWAPPREHHLGDRTAFDAFVIYRTSGEVRAFVGIETKYTEPFSQKEYDSHIYREVTASTGVFKQGAGEVLVGRATNQLWRMAMLAASMLRGREFSHGSIVVLSLEDDRHAHAAVNDVREQVVDPSFTKFLSLETLCRIALGYEGLRDWAELLSKRYFDTSPVTH